jgi:hypothetical protein
MGEVTKRRSAQGQAVTSHDGPLRADAARARSRPYPIELKHADPDAERRDPPDPCPR